MPEDFQILTEDPGSKARRGRFSTPHGEVETPVFMPVGTQGTVKAVTPGQLRDTGAQILLGNTYHLQLRPGAELIRELGGLQRFMGWNAPVLTDSGGFQVFSLAKMRRITDEGIAFQSHLNGEAFFLSPAEAIRIQRDLGSDIAMALDECPPYPCAEREAAAAVDRTVRWAEECLREGRESGFFESGARLFGIVQGSNYPELRRDCAARLEEMGFDGYAVGGVSVGEPEKEMLEQVAVTAEVLPRDKPRYAMGLGTPPQMLRMVAAGIDMFDCVMPTRLARHGTAFTPEGVVNLRNESFRRDPRPLVEGMDNITCRHFSRAYLRHLVVAGEILGCTLLSLHNLHFYLDLMSQARRRIETGGFSEWSREWIARYESKPAGKGTGA